MQLSPNFAKPRQRYLQAAEVQSAKMSTNKKNREYDQFSKSIEYYNISIGYYNSSKYFL
jgi:hypothetical protein